MDQSNPGISECVPLSASSAAPPAAKGNLSEHKRVCLGPLLPQLPVCASSRLLSPPLPLVGEREMGRDQGTAPWGSFAVSCSPHSFMCELGPSLDVILPSSI